MSIYHICNELLFKCNRVTYGNMIYMYIYIYDTTWLYMNRMCIYIYIYTCICIYVYRVIIVILQSLGRNNTVYIFTYIYNRMLI